jgi:hypothetical protein
MANSMGSAMAAQLYRIDLGDGKAREFVSVSDYIELAESVADLLSFLEANTAEDEDDESAHISIACDTDKHAEALANLLDHLAAQVGFTDPSPAKAA